MPPPGQAELYKKPSSQYPTQFLAEEYVFSYFLLYEKHSDPFNRMQPLRCNRFSHTVESIIPGRGCIL